MKQDLNNFDWSKIDSELTPQPKEPKVFSIENLENWGKYILNSVKDVSDRIGITPAASEIIEGAKELSDNAPKGGARMLNGLLGLISSPFMLGDQALREIPGGDKAADTIALPFEGAAGLYRIAEKGLDEGLSKIGFDKQTQNQFARALLSTKGISLTNKQIEEASQEINKLGQGVAQFAAGALIGKAYAKAKGEPTLLEKEKKTYESKSFKKDLENRKEDFISKSQVGKEAKSKLKDIGYTEEQINKMNPVEIEGILSTKPAALLEPRRINLTEIPKEEQLNISQAKLRLVELEDQRVQLTRNFKDTKDKIKKKELFANLKDVNDEIKFIEDNYGIEKAPKKAEVKNVQEKPKQTSEKIAKETENSKVSEPQAPIEQTAKKSVESDVKNVAKPKVIERPTLYKADMEGMNEGAKTYKNTTFDNEKIKLQKNQDGEIFAVNSKNEVVGFYTKLSKTEADLSVAKEYQQKGIGKTLMQEFIKENPKFKIGSGGFTELGKKTYESVLQEKSKIDNNQPAIDRMTKEGKSPKEISTALDVPIKDVENAVKPEKQPYEMTKDEFRNNSSWYKDRNGNVVAYGKGDIAKYSHSQKVPNKYGGEPAQDYTHRKLVKQALKEGKKVPDNVLKDYPDLVKDQPTKALNVKVEDVKKAEPLPKAEIKKPKSEDKLIQIKNDAPKYSDKVKITFNDGKKSTIPIKDLETIKGLEDKIKKVDYLQGNKVFTEEKYQKALKYQRDNLNKLGSNPFLDPEYYKSAVNVAGYYFESGIRTFAEFSKKMIEKYGDDVKPYIIKLWQDVKKKFNRPFEVDKSNMTPKEKFKTAITEKKLNDEFEKFVKDKNIDEVTKGKIIDIIQNVDNEKKYSSKNVGTVRRYLLDKGVNLTKKYGAPGGEFFNQLMSANAKWKGIINTAYEKYMNPLMELKEKEQYFRFNDAFNKVVDALEDRKNSIEILKDDPLAQKIYGHTEGLYSYFRKQLEEKGYETRDDYFTHVMRNQIISDLLDRARGLEDVGNKTIHEYFNANSNYLKERVKEELPNMRTDFGVLQNYIYSASRELAYKDFMEFVSNDFVKLIGKTDKTLAQTILRNVLNPEASTGRFLQLAKAARNNLYRAYLWNNVKLSAQNLFQKELAKLYISKEAESLTNQIYRNRQQPTGRLLDAMTETSNETPSYLESGKLDKLEKVSKEDNAPMILKKEGNASEALDRVDIFRKTEKSNWVYSELAGIINSVMRNTKAKTLSEVIKALEDQKIFDLAVREGRDLAAKTQFSPDAAFRPLAYDVPLVRTLAMFTRYPLGASELFIKTLFKKLEGSEGSRAQNILRRGLTEAAKPVELLQSTEFLRKTLETALKDAKKQKYNLGIEKPIKQYIDFLKIKEMQLNKTIKELEPITRGRSAKKWAKYIAINAAISVSYRFLTNMLYNLLGTKDEESTGDIILRSLLDASPLPLYRFNPSEAIQTPILPDIGLLTFGNFTPKRALKTVTKFGLNITPGLNIINQTTKTITGKEIPDLIIK